MDKKQPRPQGKSRKYSGDKLLTLPGVSEAIDLVEQHAWVRVVDEAIGEAAKGEFGARKSLAGKSTVANLLTNCAHWSRCSGSMPRPRALSNSETPSNA